MSVEEKHTQPDLLNHVIETLSAPDVILHILRTRVGQEDSNMVLAKTIKTDSQLTQSVLRISNSAFYGVSEQAETVEDAVRIIGFNGLQAMAVSAALIGGVWIDYDEFGSEHLWGHSLRCGLFAELIADKVSNIEPSVAFTLGVLHDIGRAIIIQNDPKRYCRVVERAKQERVYLWRAERDELGFDHAEVGARIIEEWQAPESYSDAIRHHHLPELEVSGRKIAFLLALADSLSHLCYPEDLWKDGAQPVYRGLWDPLGLSEDEVRSLIARKDTIWERSYVFLDRVRSRS